MKRPHLLPYICSSLLILGCKSKSPDENKDFFPALSYIKSQVAHVDTSLYTIMKIVKTDSVADTSIVKRDQFKALAADFLNLPDITSKKLRKDYEENKLYDADLNQAILNYMPKNPDAEIRQQQITILPGQGKDEVRSIFINRIQETADSSVQKSLLWQVDKRFQVVTSIQKPNQPEKVRTLEVIWNDFPPAK